MMSTPARKKTDMGNVCVVGGGPAGMMAAYAAAENGHTVTLYEKNEKLGKKLYLTGKGRCNLTNAAPIEDFFTSVVQGGAFLYSAFYTFDNTQLIQMLERFGMKTKTERGGRVFPLTDKSSDVIKALSKALKSVGARIKLGTKIDAVIINGGRVAGVKYCGECEAYDSVIIATGGLSYTSTGSTGDGYIFAKAAGHNISALYASLVGLDTSEDTTSLAGLTLKNVTLTLFENSRRVFREQGELLFTHTGISGPLVLSASALMGSKGPFEADIDLKPALDQKMLDQRLLRDFEEKSNKDFAGVLGGLVPSKLSALIADRSGIHLKQKAHSVTRVQRSSLCAVLKSLKFSITGKRPLEEAVVTRGGVDIKQIDPSTMQSRLCAGLYFAGEVIDVDALTGGYNLQIAFSTGYLAGTSC